MAGILRAQSIRAKRRIPYHRALTLLILIGLLGLPSARAQTAEHYEAILIDTSGSISRGGATNELFREYLTATRQLLLSEPANSRIWVSTSLPTRLENFTKC
jgi:hypothetical protein